jgi:hypothetical protein
MAEFIMQMEVDAKKEKTLGHSWMEYWVLDSV